MVAEIFSVADSVTVSVYKGRGCRGVQTVQCPVFSVHLARTGEPTHG